MSVQGIKNTTLRRITLVIFGPPVVLWAVVGGVWDVLKDVPWAFREAWNG